jgi:hypothetical protein
MTVPPCEAPSDRRSLAPGEADPFTHVGLQLVLDLPAGTAQHVFGVTELLGRTKQSPIARMRLTVPAKRGACGGQLLSGRSTKYSLVRENLSMTPCDKTRDPSHVAPAEHVSWRL